MGIDYDAKLFFGATIPYFGTQTMNNIKNFDAKFSYELTDDDDNEYQDDDDPGLYEFEELINDWLKNNYPSWKIISPAPYYDCHSTDRNYILTYDIPNEMTINELLTVMEKINIEEFTKIYGILTGDQNIVPKLQAVPNVW